MLRSLKNDQSDERNDIRWYKNIFTIGNTVKTSTISSSLNRESSCRLHGG